MADTESNPPTGLDQLENSEKEQAEVQDKKVDVTPIEDEKDSDPSPKESAAKPKAAPVTGTSILLDLVSSDPSDAPSSSRPEKRVYSGVCQWFDTQRGFGFIRVNDGEDAGVEGDLWVHQRNISTPDDSENGVLEKNQECKFEISKKLGPDGTTKLSAQNVEPGPKPKREKKPRHKGVCIWYDETPGKTFGFIEVEGTGQEIFVHLEAIKHGKGLVEGQSCDFEIVEQAGGKFRAHNVNPGKAPKIDPEVLKVRSGKVARWIEERGFGFIRPDNPGEEEVIVHRSNLKTSGTELVEGQAVKYKIRKRTPRRKRAGDDADAPEKEDKNVGKLESFDVIPGDIPKKQVYQGIVKFFDKDNGFGFISRKGRNEDYFVHKDSVVSKEEDITLEEGQHVKFCVTVGRNRKQRAVDVIPGAKVDEQGKLIELPEEEEYFDPYLPSHDPANRNLKPTRAKKNNKRAGVSSPTAATPEIDDGLTEAERLKKDFNYRKKQRRKRAKENKGSGGDSEDEVVAPKKPVVAPVSAPSKSSSSSSSSKAKVPEKAVDSPRASRPSKKQKKAAKAKAAEPVQESKEKEPEKPKQKPAQKSASKPKAKSPAADEGKALFRKNKKQSKKKKRGNTAAELKKKRAEEAERERDAVFDAFDKNTRKSQDGFLTMAYKWILSLCKQ